MLAIVALLLGACGGPSDEQAAPAPSPKPTVTRQDLLHAFLELPVWPRDQPPPPTFEAGLDALDQVLNPPQRAIAASIDPQEFATQTHDTLGRWIRNSWNLWGTNAIAADARAKGFRHADDVSSSLVLSYARREQGLPVALEAQIERFQQYWRHWEMSRSTNPPANP